MRDSFQPVWLTRSRRALPLTAALLLSTVLVAGCTGGSATPAASTSATPASTVSGCASCISPRLFRVAYGMAPLLANGIDGRGETVTFLAGASSSSPGPVSSPGSQGGPVADQGPASDIRQSLKAFDAMFSLPAAQVEVVNTLAQAAAPWQAASQEIQDAEMVHAIAPAATLRVVLLPANALANAATATADMIAGLRLAVSGTNVISIDWSLGEHFFAKSQVAEMNSVLQQAADNKVTVVATSGDNGAFSDAWFGGTPVKEVSLPASSPLVLAVGGTTLTINSDSGSYVSETTWNGQSGASLGNGVTGGGFSHLYARPAYQDGVRGIPAMRGVPDVAADASAQSGLATVMTGSPRIDLQADSGTSADTPLWAGLVTLADQYAHRGLGSVNAAIYRIAHGSHYHQAFHDITSGSNIQTIPYPGTTAGYQAAPGWDPATGWGTPDAQVLVPLLAS